MGAYQGTYTRSGDPEAMFDEQNLYLAPLQQNGKAAVDADFNEWSFSYITQMRRVVQNTIGDGSANDGFKIAESVISTTNNFTIKGGDGTDEGAGRMFVDGFGAMLKSDVEYTGAFTALMAKIHPQSTGLAALVLTDSTANWTVNELAGRTLTPDIATPATTFTVASNTTTTITVTSGDMTILANQFDFYRLELSTPGTSRVDEVYLDIFLDEVDDTEDTNLIHTDLTPSQSAAYRIVLRQFVRVKEGAATPAGHVDADGRQHFTKQIATITRSVANSAITSVMLVDERGEFTAGGGPGGPGGGASIAEVSSFVSFTRNITAITPPTPGTVGTDTDSLDHPPSVITGQRFSFVVPDDYSTGDLTVLVVYRMLAGTSSPNNQIRVEGRAEVHDVDVGATTLLPANNLDLVVPDGTVDITRTVLFTVPNVNVTIGDTVEFFVKRLGTHGSDLATTDTWQVIAYAVRYTSTIANRAKTTHIEILRNTDEPAPTPVSIGTETDAESYPTGSDAELKATFTVPEEWDGFTPPFVRCVYSMDTGAVGTIRLATEGEIANVVGGSLDIFGIFDFDFVPPADTGIHRTLTIREIDPLALNIGDAVTIKLARRTAVGGNHVGAFRLIAVTVTFAQVAQGGFNATFTEEKYLEAGVFGNQSPSGVDGDTAMPDLPGGDLEILDRMVSTIASGRIDVAYQGRLATFQTQVSQLRILLKGIGTTPQYRLRVFNEGVEVFDSGVLAAPGTLTETLLVTGDLLPQPTGSKRYHVLVEAYLDASEELLVGRPRARQE